MENTKRAVPFLAWCRSLPHQTCGSRLALSLALVLLSSAHAAAQITGTASSCSGLASCSFALTGTGGSGRATTSAFVAGYVGQSPLNVSGTISFILPGESNYTYNAPYRGQAVLDGYSSTAGTLYQVTATFSAIDANTGTLVTGSAVTVVGIKGHSGRGGGNYYTLVSGSITIYTSSLRGSSTVLVCSPTSLTPGGTTTCTVTVSDSGAGAASTPTGTVTFNQSTAGVFSPAASCQLVNGTGTVTFTVNPEAAGYYINLSASYGGDAVHLGSTSANVLLSVYGGGDNGD